MCTNLEHAYFYVSLSMYEVITLNTLPNVLILGVCCVTIVLAKKNLCLCILPMILYSVEGEGVEDTASHEEEEHSLGLLHECFCRRPQTSEAGPLSSGEGPSLELFLAMDNEHRLSHGIPGLPHQLLGAFGSIMYMMQMTFTNSLSSSNCELSVFMVAGDAVFL